MSKAPSPKRKPFSKLGWAIVWPDGHFHVNETRAEQREWLPLCEPGCRLVRVRITEITRKSP